MRYVCNDLFLNWRKGEGEFLSLAVYISLVSILHLNPNGKYNERTLSIRPVYLLGRTIDSALEKLLMISPSPVFLSEIDNIEKPFVPGSI